jgi:hypothetical protein
MTRTAGGEDGGAGESGMESTTGVSEPCIDDALKNDAPCAEEHGYGRCNADAAATAAFAAEDLMPVTWRPAAARPSVVRRFLSRWRTGRTKRNSLAGPMML